MFPLPAIPLVPKMHGFFELEQAKTFMLIFGIALLAQFFLPWTGPGWFNFSAGTIWPLIVGAGFVTLSFVPGLADKLKPNLLFLIVAGAGALGVLWSFAAGGTGQFFWLGALASSASPPPSPGSSCGRATAISSTDAPALRSHHLRARAALLRRRVPLVLIFTRSASRRARRHRRHHRPAVVPGLHLPSGAVMNVFLKKENAEQEQVERFGSVLFVAALVVRSSTASSYLARPCSTSWSWSASCGSPSGAWSASSRHGAGREPFRSLAGLLGLPRAIALHQLTSRATRAG
jgi:hypothetical protein